MKLKESKKLEKAFQTEIDERIKEKIVREIMENKNKRREGLWQQ